VDTSRLSVARELHTENRDRAAGDQHTRLLELASRYLQVTNLPDDVEILREELDKQRHDILKLCKLLGRLSDQVAQLERRPS
jgi:hypothetical protein